MKAFLLIAATALQANAATNNDISNNVNNQVNNKVNNPAATAGALQNPPPPANTDRTGINSPSTMTANPIPPTQKDQAVQQNTQPNLYGRQTIMEAQQALVSQGFPLVVDGSIGSATSNAVRQYQSRNGLPQTGVLDSDTLRSLRVSPNSTPLLQ